MTEQTDNPTKVDVDSIVNPFNGLSDDHKAAEVAQKLWDAGRFNPDGKPDAQQGQADAEPVEASTPTEEAPAWHQDFLAMEKAQQFGDESRAQRSQELQRAMQLGQQAHQQLTAQWERIRAENPQAAQQLLGEFQARQAEIQQHMSNVHAQAQQLAGEYLAREKEKLLVAMPEWRDSNTFAAAKADMLAYARQHGISEADIGTITDYRHLLALYHASQHGKPPAPKTPGVRLKPNTPKAPPKASPKAPNEPRGLNAARDRFMDNRLDVSAQSAYAQRLLEAGA